MSPDERAAAHMVGNLCPGVQAIAELLSLERKKEVEKFAKKLTITTTDLDWFCEGCQRFGYVHDIVRHHFPSPVEEFSKKDLEQLSAGNLDGVVSKIAHVFFEQKNRVVRTLQNGARWHVFYFSESDVASEESGAQHWEHGTHLHFVNHLWPHLSLGSVRAALAEHHSDIGGRLHIRFVASREQPPEVKRIRSFAKSALGLLKEKGTERIKVRLSTLSPPSSEKPIE